MCAGCEFFKEWRDNAYVGEAITFDWTQVSVDDWGGGGVVGDDDDLKNDLFI